MASEYLKWKYRDVKPDEKIEYTKQEKLRNWWQYHKWWLLAGVLVLAAGADILVHMLGLGQVKPDYQVAYVASVPPGDEAAAALEAAMASRWKRLTYSVFCARSGRRSLTATLWPVRRSTAR